jgi:hypothetical protein
LRLPAVTTTGSFDLFVPAAQLGPPLIPLSGLGKLSGVAIALRQVEDRPGVVGIASDGWLTSIATPLASGFVKANTAA